MATQVYTSGLLALADGSISFGNANVYAVLVTGYTFSAAHSTYSDISANEITDADYSPADVAGKSVAASGTNILYDSGDISFGTEVSIAAEGVIFVVGDEAAPDAGDQLLFHWDFGGSQSSTDSQFQINTPAGIYELQPQ